MNEDKFSGKAEAYSKYRPSYPNSLIEWLYENTTAENVVDIGAGTGIFTECLLKKPWHITAVEPNEDMLAYLNKLSSDVEIVKASAESTGLTKNTYDLVTVAQAFHWFDKSLFKKECQRILKPNGKLAVIFNKRCQNDFNRERNKVCMKYCDSYHSGHVHTGYEDFDGERFLREEYFETMDYLSVENQVIMSKERFIGDNLSRSYALKPNDEHYEMFVAELEEVFEKYCSNGVVHNKYITDCFLGSF